MAQGQFVQTPCPKCGTVVWISPAAGMGFCPGCHTQVALQAGAAAPPPAAGAYPGYGQQAPGATSTAPTSASAPAPQFSAVAMKTPKAPSRAAAIGGAVLAVIAAVGVGVVKTFVLGKKGHASVKSLGTDAKSADIDKLISGTKELAKKWRSDAVFYEIAANGVKKDGTVDLSDGNVVVTFVSAKGVTSSSNAQRTDSVKKFSINGDDVNYQAKWNVKKPWSGFSPTPEPTCSASKLAKKLAEDGFGGKGSMLAINPRITDVPAWHAVWDKESRWFDLETCKELKLTMGDGKDDTQGGGEE
jgi:hypothetical protein